MGKIATCCLKTIVDIPSVALIASRDTSRIGNKIPAWIIIFWMRNLKLCLSLVSGEILRRRNNLERNNESSLKTIVSSKDFFWSEQKSSIKNNILKVVIQNSAIKGYYEFSLKVTQRLRNANIGDSYFPTDKSNLILALCKIKVTLLG